MALGACACVNINHMDHILADVVPYLIENLSSEHSLLRSISAWTLSSCAKWVVHHDDPDLFDRAFKELLQMMLDNNKKTQRAACYAVSVFINTAQHYVHDYLEEVINTFESCMHKYQYQSRIALYDCIGTLCLAAGKELQDDTYVQILMPKYMEFWEDMNLEDDFFLIPHLESMTAIIQAFEEFVIEYAEAIFEKCVLLLQRSIEIKYACIENNEPLPQPDLLIVILDCMGAISDHLPKKISSMWHYVDENFDLPVPLVEYIKDCAEDGSQNVRRNAFGMIGDLASLDVDILEPVFDDVMALMLETMSSRVHIKPSVISNAAWAMGELVESLKEEMEPFVDEMLELMVKAIREDKIKVTLLQNLTITLGKIMKYFPDASLQYLESLTQEYCVGLTYISDAGSREESYMSFCKLVEMQPELITQDFFYFCDALCFHEDTSNELEELFQSLMETFKEALSEEDWDHYFSRFPDLLRESMATRFGL
eukprot:TRINITY_DN624_c0_g1_i4.p1 TRINITY_DN624_c0_g1~~TRINITY_DN624_c0_g1_i4.p1  ORF type:complete len:483 (-),score=137.86 TRINITY_DN624_c0_g1_i4:492-1940(-)